MNVLLAVRCSPLSRLARPSGGSPQAKAIDMKSDPSFVSLSEPSLVLNVVTVSRLKMSAAVGLRFTADPDLMFIKERIHYGVEKLIVPIRVSH